MTKKHLIASFIALGFLVMPVVALSQGVDFGTDQLSGVGLGSQDIRVTVVTIIRVALGVLGLLTLVLIIYAGWVWMTSAGKRENIERAKKILLNAVVGLLIIILAFAITTFIFNQLVGRGIFGNGGNECDNLNMCIADCTYCNDQGQRQYDPTCFTCTVGSTGFVLRDVQTANGSGDPKNDVYLCSNVQPKFNNRINAAAALSSIGAGNTGVYSSNGAQIAGNWQVSNQKVMTFDPTNDLDPNTTYEVRFGTDLEDTTGDQISGCVGTVCETTPGTFYGWEFTTGTTNDEVPPSINTAYPVLSTAINGYPTRIIPRSPTIDFTFSEAINYFSIADNSGNPLSNAFRLQQVTVDEGNNYQITGTVGSPFANSNFDTQLLNGDKTVRVSATNGFLLEPFTWYAITVQDVTDLCSNEMMPTPVTWVFQTNDAVPGFTSWYPTGTNVCPDVGVISFTSAVSLHNQSLTFVFDGNSTTHTFTETNTSVDTGQGILSVFDTNPPYAENFKVFNFQPYITLVPGTQYFMDIIVPGIVVNQQGDVLEEHWSFTVAPAASCSCSPYIASLSPSQGAPGQCLTINGACFAGTSADTGSITNVYFDGSPQSPLGQSSSFVTSNIPTSYSNGDTVGVSVELTYAAPSPFGTLPSNTRNFFVNTDTQYTGPCLVDINPDAACHGAQIDLLGQRLGDGTVSGDVVTFSSGGAVPSSNISNWVDAKIDFTLPGGFGDSSVSVTTNGQTSNSLPFDVACGAGAGCDLNPDPLICDPDVGACSGGLQCINCVCTDTGGGGGGSSFVVTTGNPNCSTACTGSEVSAVFSSTVDSTTVNTNSVGLYRCADGPNCMNLSPESYTVSTAGTKVLFNSFVLQAGESYRVIIDESVTGINGVSVENLNYDNPNNGTGPSDSYSWTFTVEATDCAVSSVATIPATINMSAVGQNRSIVGEVSTTQGCVGGQLLHPWNYDWSWTSDATTIASVTSVQTYPPNTDPVQTVASQSVGNTLVWGGAEGFSDNTAVTVTSSFVESSHWPSCDTACMNAEIGIAFNDDVDPSTVSGSVDIGRCPDNSTGLCDTITPISFSVTTAGNQILFNTPTLQPGASYRVIIRGDHHTFTGVRSDDGAPLGELVYDDPTYNGLNGNDSYSWVFSTNDQVCDITGVDILPSTKSFTSLGVQSSFTAKALSDQGCTAGPYVNAWDYTWTWTSFDPSIATLADVPEPVTAVTSVSNGATQIEGSAAGFADIADVTVAATGGVGSSCDADGDPNNGMCLASNAYCNADLYCEESSCSCQTPPPPSILDVLPDGTLLQCRNSVFKVIFDQRMNRGAAQNYFSIEDISNGENIPYSISSYIAAVGDEGCSWNAGCTVFVLSPTVLLPESAQIDVVVLGGIQSIYGQTLGSDYGFAYSTGVDVCEFDGVEIFPGYWLFTSNVPPENTLDYTAFAFSNNDGRVYLAPMPGVYNWSWEWIENDPDDLITMDGNTTDNVATVTVPARGQGVARVQVNAEVTEDTVYAGEHLGRSDKEVAAADIFICDFPWPDPPAYSIGYDAEMKYCRGNTGDELLPALGSAVHLDTGDDLLLDDVFVVQHEPDEIPIAGSDIIGIRIFANPNHTSAQGWYELQDFPQGSPRSTVVDGYPAVVDGVTTYVHFTDVVGSTARSYILVISHNQGAVEDTKQIYNKLLSNLTFNVTALTAQGKADLQQDMLRIGGMGHVIGLVAAGYAGDLDIQQNELSKNDFSIAAVLQGSLPDLSVGTFIPGMTTSRWPLSWQGVLGNELGETLPVDPLNTFSSCPTGYDPASCFNTNLNPQFYCEDGSHIYIYEDGVIYGNLEYKGLSWFGVGGSGDDTCRSFSMSYNSGGSFGLQNNGFTIASANKQDFSLQGNQIAVALPVEQSAPSITILSDETVHSGGPNPTVTYSVSANGIASYVVNDVVVENRSVGPGKKTYTFSGLNGENTLEIRVKNSYGTGSDTMLYTVDSESPQIKITDFQERSSSASTVMVSYTTTKSGTVVCRTSTGQTTTLVNTKAGASTCELRDLPEESLTISVEITAADGSGVGSDSIEYTVSKKSTSTSNDDRLPNTATTDTQEIYPKPSSLYTFPTGLMVVYEPSDTATPPHNELSFPNIGIAPGEYTIERSVGSLRAFGALAKITDAATTYQDFDITEGQTYYYRITKNNSIEHTSTYSNTASVVSADVTTPLIGKYELRSSVDLNSLLVFDWTATDNRGLETVELWRADASEVWEKTKAASIQKGAVLQKGFFEEQALSDEWKYELRVEDQVGNTTVSELPIFTSK